MIPPASCAPAPGSATPVGQARRCMDELRALLANTVRASKIDEVLAGLTAACERVASEHAGMAEELLGAYEQLGVVFEVTSRLPSVKREQEVLDLFLDSLRRSFTGRRVLVAVPATEGGWPLTGAGSVQGWQVQGGAADLEDWLRAVVLRAREEQHVLVEKRPTPAATGGVAETMVAPVFAGTTFVCAIILTRSADHQEFRTGDMLLLESLATYCGDLLRNHRLMRELQDLSLAMVRALVNAVDQKDEYTSGHSLRVAFYASQLGKELKLPAEDFRMLQWSALLHDVGKIGIRDDVLKKPGRLTDEEFAHIKEHPVRSHKVVQEVPQLAGALAGVLYHHERFDGTGYPAGLKGQEIPLQARIIQIADVFDALTSSRSYRPAYEWRKALDILRDEAGKTVDPNLQQLFDRHMRDVLEADPKAWERKVKRANQFASAFSSIDNARATDSAAAPAREAMARRSRT